MADKFNLEKHKTPSGKQIYISMSNNPSSLQARDLLSRARDGGGSTCVAHMEVPNRTRIRIRQSSLPLPLTG